MTTRNINSRKEARRIVEELIKISSSCRNMHQLSYQSGIPETELRKLLECDYPRAASRIYKNFK